MIIIWLNHVRKVMSLTAIDIEHLTKLRSYCMFKESICVGNYALYNPSPSGRSVMAQLRFWILPFDRESGRFCKQPVEVRLCTRCNSYEIKEQCCFLCDRWSILRNEWAAHVIRKKLVQMGNTCECKGMSLPKFSSDAISYKRKPQQNNEIIALYLCV